MAGFLNTSFELWTGGNCDSWTKTNGSWAADTAEAQDGSYAIKLTTADGYSTVASCYQDIDALSYRGQLITVTIWLYGSYGSGGDTVTRVSLNSGVAQATADNNGSSNVWVKKTLSITVPTDATTIRVTITRNNYGFSGTSGWFDWLTFSSPFTPQVIMII